ncbi:CPBP family intramembrane glutamic endopeptidase [Erwinia sp. P6884]|uniref:CPBP family intramembrane glutamic endopeptidase n=1 Tax=Erwinia sp. P6884 TaxID=3141450 RepID=UPI00318B01DF
MNHPSEKVNATLRCIGMFLIWYSLTRVVSALPNYAELRASGMLMPVLCLLEFAVLVPLYGWYCRRYQDIPLGDIRAGQAALFSLLLLGLIFSQSFYLQEEAWTSSQIGADRSGMLPFVLAVVLLAPVYEEILFRGFVLQGLLTWAPDQRLACALLTSIAFAAVHTQYAHPQTLIALMLLSLLLCYARLLSGGLKLPLFLHMLNNLIGVSPWLWLTLSHAFS